MHNTTQPLAWGSDSVYWGSAHAYLQARQPLGIASRTMIMSDSGLECNTPDLLLRTYHSLTPSIPHYYRMRNYSALYRYSGFPSVGSTMNYVLSHAGYPIPNPSSSYKTQPDSMSHNRHPLLKLTGWLFATTYYYSAYSIPPCDRSHHRVRRFECSSSLLNYRSYAPM